MRNILVLFLLFIIGCKSTKVPADKAVEKLGPNPYFIIDGQPSDHSDIMKYKPTDVASITVYYGRLAVNTFGEKAKDGAVSISTKIFATNKYETLFKTFSKDYEKALRENDKSDIQYILNGRILTKDIEGDLASINNKLLKQLRIIDERELADKFKVTNKKVGVLIKSRKP